MSRVLRVIVLTILAAIHMAPPGALAAPTHFWSRGFGNNASTSETPGDVVVDNSGNVILAAYSDGANVDFGGGVLSGSMFLVKFDRFGTHVWSRGFNGGYVTKVAVDASGNIFLAGEFYDSIDLGGGVLTSLGDFDILLAKFDKFGNHVWSKSFGSAQAQFAGGLSIDSFGRLLFSGGFYNTVNFGGALLTSVGGLDAFLVKFDTSGAHIWSKQFGFGDQQAAQGVGSDGTGSVIVTGAMRGQANFGGGVLTSAGGNDVFLAKFDPSGVHQWSSRFGDSGHQGGGWLAIDASGNVVVGGNMEGTADFGGGVLGPANGSDMFLVKFNGLGTHQWSHLYGGVGSQQMNDMALDPTGGVALCSTFEGTIDFGGGILTSAGQNDIAIAKFSAAGEHEWGTSFGDAQTQHALGIAVGKSGNAVLCAQFFGTVDFGGDALLSSGMWDIAVAKFGSCAAGPTIESVLDIGNDQGKQVRVVFSRSGHDDPESPLGMQEYSLFRRGGPLQAGTVVTRSSPSGQSMAGWDYVGSVPAYGDNAYQLVVPTLADSTISAGMHYSVFKARAVTDDHFVFFDSPADSGYSLDNLAPSIPGSLAFNNGWLSWGQTAAADFDYFTVYGGSSGDFGSASLIDYTIDPSMDMTASPYAYYFVTATDFSGNEGNPAFVGTPTDVGVTPRAYVLSVSNYPNPFNPATTVRYTVPSRGAVTVAVYDARGERVAALVSHEERSAGAYAIEWNGNSDSGASVTSGVYFVRIEHNGVTRSRKIILLK